MSKDKQSTAKTLTRGVQRSQKAVLRQAFPSLMAKLSSGSPLDPLLNSLGVDWRIFYDYIETRPELAQTYAHARRICVEKWISEIVPMSDNVIGAEMSVVTATRNAVDARKWVAGKLAPREYGDAPTGVTINNQTNVMVVSDDRLKQLQALRQQMLVSPQHEQRPD
jgi:hypothetical protein